MNRTIIIALAITLAGAPSAMAAWYGPGSVEPDTEWDGADGLMFTDPDISTDQNLKQVYFNAFPVAYLTGVNPNSGQLETHVTPYTVHIQGMIGVWKDCNNDGYIGYAEHALSEYRAEILEVVDGETSICPAGTSVYNDGEWVYEFFHMGPQNATTDPAYNLINTNVTDGETTLPGVWMWGDLGAPGATPGFSCPLSPPYGSTARTGAMIRWLDCSGGGLIARSVNDVDAATGLGIGFADPKNPQESDSPLNQEPPVNLWGNPYSHETGLLETGKNDPAATTWDCSGEATHVRDPTAPEDGPGELRRVGVRDPTGLVQNQSIEEENDTILINQNGYVGTNLNNISDDEGDIHRIYPVAPGVHSDPLHASYVDMLNQTERGILNDCEEDPNGGTFSELISVLTNPEGPLQSEGQSSVGKNEVGSEFTFFDGTPSNERAQPVIGVNAPNYLGLGLKGGQVNRAPGWSSSTIITSEEFYVSPESGPTERRWFTFYVYVAPSLVGDYGLSFPGGDGVGIYGSESCGAGVPDNGWACDPDVWYIEHITGDDADPTGTRIRVGQEYQFRDVDCFNGLGICE